MLAIIIDMSIVQFFSDGQYFLLLMAGAAKSQTKRLARPANL